MNVVSDSAKRSFQIVFRRDLYILRIALDDFYVASGVFLYNGNIVEIFAVAFCIRLDDYFFFAQTGVCTLR